ncbi:hypothetical protein B0T25DRAFT_568915 [Lasiosphaeria hispida]|uniref:Uncharacterized protein n=1 Tax=Lasiosphaeria hispida TaxID=260671 RepID=A0AAJ0HJG7_9PEZI|nr:hypothetical protein B0T25DRAFT_568915 [Lasiosphaeria hispida]
METEKQQPEMNMATAQHKHEVALQVQRDNNHKADQSLTMNSAKFGRDHDIAMAGSRKNGLEHQHDINLKAQELSLRLQLDHVTAMDAERRKHAPKWIGIYSLAAAAIIIVPSILFSVLALVYQCLVG